MISEYIIDDSKISHLFFFVDKENLIFKKGAFSLQQDKRTRYTVEQDLNLQLLYIQRKL